MTKRLKLVFEFLLDYLFPWQCVVCGVYGDLICTNCRRNFVRILPPVCQKCGRPEASGILCSSCWAAKSNVDLLRSVYIFDESMRAAIHELKYNNVWAIAGCLGELMADYYIQSNMEGDVICPVPLHNTRLRQRGYNQSYLLAKTIADCVHIPVNQDTLIRTYNSTSQASADNVGERRMNVEGAFSCKDSSLAGMKVLLIDDVCTSGSTIEACAAALKSAGAGKVIGFTLARELLNKE